MTQNHVGPVVSLCYWLPLGTLVRWGLNGYPVGRELGARIVTTTDMLRARRDRIIQLAEQHGAHNVRVFGSVARGDAGPTSDIDLLVEMDRGRSLLDLIELSQELEAFLDRKVDILTDEGLSPYLEQRIHAEAVSL